MKNSTTKSNKIFLILGVVFIFLLWELLSLISQNDFIVPSISNTMKALGEILTIGDTYNILFSTILRLLSSITICFILALTLAVFSNINERVKYFLKPLISLLKTLPVATIIIMLLVMIGRSIAPYFIVGLVVLPLIYEIVLNALEAIDKDIIDEVKMVSSGKDFTVLKRIYLPLITPYLLTSLIQAFGLGLKVLVMAEFIAETKNSIGEVIRFYKNEALTEYVFAWTIILVLFILLIDLLLHYIKKKIL
jgi:NitT/TauT family transport system permease protein